MSRILKIVINSYYGETVISKIIRNIFPSGPHPGLAVAVNACPSYQSIPHSLTENAHDSLLENGILWTAPRNRRSRERRLIKKFGSVNGHQKMLPVLKLLTCDNCGHVHEPGRLCPNCYSQNKDITLAMQEAMKKSQGLNPIENEVLPLFEGEKVDTDNEFFEGKRIVEVPKPRPQWFSRRLTQKSNVTTSDSSTVTVKSSLG